VISTFVIENFVLVRIAIAVAVALSIIVAALLVRAGLTGRKIAGVLGGIATLVVLGLTFAPDKYPLPAATCSLEAHSFYTDYLNVTLFYLPVLFAVIATRSPWTVLAFGVGMSAAIEAIQAALPVLGRRCDLNDWATNSFGTLLGVLVGFVVILVVARLRSRAAAAAADALPRA